MFEQNTARSNPRRLVAAVIGAGRWGQNWVRVAGQADRAKLGWVIDPKPVALDRAAILVPDVALGTRIEQALDEIDLAIVCTPPQDHGNHVRQLLRAKKHVLVEKPLAMSTSTATKLGHIARTNHRQLMVGHQLLFHPAFERLGHMVRQGALGTIRSIKAKRTGPIDFRCEPDVLWAYGPHDISMMLALVGRPPTRTSLSAARFNPNRRLSQLGFELQFGKGICASIELAADEPTRTRRLVVHGDRGTAVFDDAERPGRLFRLECEPMEIHIPAAEPLVQSYRHFLSCIYHNAPPRTGLRHGLAVTRILTELNNLAATLQPGQTQIRSRSSMT